MKLTLEEFKEILEKIQKHEQERDIISNIMVKGSTGFIDFGIDILDEFVKILEKLMNDEKTQWISWWLWEDVNKVIYLKKENYNYDVTTPEDLYYYLTKKYDKITRVAK